MTVSRRRACLALLVICLFSISPRLTLAQEGPAQLEQLQQENQQLHQQLRRARRDLARLKVEESAPEWKDVVTGLGVIFGLAGLAMMVNARRP